MYERIKELAERNRKARTEEERKAVKAEMEAIQREDPKAYAEALEALIRETSEEVEELSMAEKLGEVTKIVSMSYIAKKYFGKTRSWLSHKLNGDKVNGRRTGFTDDELDTLKAALSDISKTIGDIGMSLR